MRPAQSERRYKPISDYGIIGNCRSAALVGRDGSIDWCCFPDFASPSLFAAILDTQRGGYFAITPEVTYSSTQRYVGDTNVLETEFETESGVCTVTDCMPLYWGDGGTTVALHQVVRQLRCQRGTVTLRVDYVPRPDYARAPVGLAVQDGNVMWTDGEMELTLESPAPMEVSGSVAQGSITLHKGEEAVFVVAYRDASTGAEADGLTPSRRVARTVLFWEGEAAEVDYEGPWRAEAIRSYLVLHLLTYLTTGAIVASPTTSLPEQIGGQRNWDYRFTWLRDAGFSIDALMSLGHMDEAENFFHWLSRVCVQCAARQHVPIVSGVGGETDLEEAELSHLEGYRGSKPVRIGNGAYTQFQHDIYGQLLSSAHLFASKGQPITDSQWEALRAVANVAAARWREPDSGIWEVRSGPFHFTYSKAMCWLALDCAIALAELTGHPCPEIEEWRHTAQAIKEEVLRNGWSERKQAFVQHYGTESMDASNLRLLLMGFLTFDDPRVASTVRRIREELGQGPFLHRYRTEETDDGLEGPEGAFILCSFWLVRVLARMGHVEEARRLFQELRDYANHLGLFSEMVDPSTGEALGNFPQAFTHIGLILAAKECGIAQECDTAS